MSVPGNINTAPPPSSFDENTEFYQESRWGKLKRKLYEEPLIPLGCGLTVWALLEATKSIKSGDKHRTNRMFRRRIYAQGFTLLAMIAGSAYWEGDRKKRNEYNELIEDKKKKDRHEAWLKELEVREQEEQELRRARDKMIQSKLAERRTSDEKSQPTEAAAKGKDDQTKSGLSLTRSALEANERRRSILSVSEAARALWERRRS